MPKLHIYKNEKETCSEFAGWLADLIMQKLFVQDRFTLALSGEEMPKMLYKILSVDYNEKIDWSRIHIFGTFANFYSHTNVKSGENLTLNPLLENLPIPPQQLHIINTNILPSESAQEYEKVLRSYLVDPSHTFDLVILGLSETGTTQSLLGYNVNNGENNYWAISLYDKEEQVFKMSLTSNVINDAVVKAFIVTGKNKQDAVESVLKGKYDPEKYPAQLIQTANKKVHWFLDENAAAKLIKPAS